MQEFEITVAVVGVLIAKGAALLAVVYAGCRLAIRHERGVLD